MRGLSHDIRGTGEPLLLLHGIGHRWQAWLPVLDLLVHEGFQTIAIDLPGFGGSPVLDGSRRPNIYTLAEAVGEFLDELGHQRLHLVGNSMGGGIALELARAGRASSVTAISPVGFWTAKERLFCQRSLKSSFQLIRALPGTVSTLVSSSIGRTLLVSQLMARPWRAPAQEMQADLRAWASAPGFLQTLDAFDDYCVRDLQELASVPLTIAWGTRDRLLIVRQARRARRLLTGADHHWLEGAGHLPMWEDPPLVAATILEGARSRSL